MLEVKENIRVPGNSGRKRAEHVTRASEAHIFAAVKRSVRVDPGNNAAPFITLQKFIYFFA